MYGKSLEIFDLSTSTAQTLAAAPNEWMAYLRTAGRLYKYPYQEQLLIYAQRPEATACASYEIWNDRMKRYIRRGSKGIALLDESDGGTRLRYVFDIADTGTRANSIDFTPWQVQAEDEASLIFTLSRAYGTKDYAPLPELLEDICIIQSFTYWQENALDIRRTLDNARISEYDGDVIGRTFRQLVAASSTYAVLSRCGVLEEATLSPADFKPLSDFNTPAALAAIGAAVSMTSGHLLRSIERTLKEERRLENERTELHPARGLPELKILTPTHPRLHRLDEMSKEPAHMLKLISCEFDFDTACVELRFTENVSLSIDCDVVERQYAHTVQQRCDLDHLVYNAPLEYAQLVLTGKVMDYLRIH